jgi:CheY-like chemotaxis protein
MLVHALPVSSYAFAGCGCLFGVRVLASKPVQVLLVEDDPADARLLVEVCKPYPSPIEFHHVSSGDDALQYLRSVESDSQMPRPDVVILDLNLPGKDGRAVLAEIRTNRSLNGIPVIVLTASPTDADVLHAFNFKAEGYLRKPVEFDELVAVFQRIELAL